MSADVLIVGAGSAGSILAERLSADPHRRVTVLEAGPGRGGAAIRALTDDATVLPVGPTSPVAHRYRTTLTCEPVRSAEIPRGRCIGGSGAVNGGYFCRALPADFDSIDLPGWSWADVEPHYLAVATDLDFPDPRGGGPIPVRRPTVFSSSTAAFLAATDAAGVVRLPDLNSGPGATGVSGVAAVPLNIVDGVRVGPGVAVLEPALGGPNLTVLAGVRATRLLIAAGRAVGVEAVGTDGVVRLDADLVVLSAGALESAHLLMLSGIGPAEELGSQGIPVVADLPVGRRCWDHPEWVLSTGWPPARRRPVLEAVLVAGNLEVRPYTAGFAAMTGQPGPNRPHVGVALMRPRSHGRVSLVSADPSVPPLIQHRYDSEPADVADLRAGCALVTDIIGGATELGRPSWSTSQHLCGTAPMGRDEHAVVDPRCRVLGVSGLLVIDASVLPRIPSRGPHATIAMLGHRAAEFC